MRAKSSDGFAQLASKISAALSLSGALALLFCVVISYVERDVLKMRGVVLSLILLGVAVIVWTEKPNYVPDPRRQAR